MNVPQLRFSGFDGEWESKKLSELGEFKKSYSFSRSSEGSGKYKHIHYGDIHSKFSGILNDDTNFPFIVESGEFEVIKDGDVVFADASEDYKDLGKTVVFSELKSENIIAGLHTHLFRPSDNLDGRFLMYFTKTPSYFSFIRRVGTGVSVLGISKGNLSALEIKKPSLEEQKKISEFFNLIDQRIKKQKEKIEDLEQFKKGMMQKIFSQELRFKDEDGGEFPEWEENLIGEFIVDHIEKTTVKNQYPVLTSSRKGLVFQKDHFKDRQVTTDENIGYHIIPRNYFTYRSRSDDGKFFFNRNTIIDKGIVSYFYPVFNVTNINPDYFWIYINNYLAKEILIEIVGTSQLVLSLNKFKKLKIVTPNLKEQEKIGNYFSKLELKIEKEKEMLMVLEEQKRGFMWGMFL